MVASKVKECGFYFRSLEVVHLCPATKDFISGTAGCSSDANEPVEGRDSGLSFLSFIHYAVDLGLFVTQTDVTASSSKCRVSTRLLSLTLCISLEVNARSQTTAFYFANRRQSDIMKHLKMMLTVHVIFLKSY